VIDTPGSRKRAAGARTAAAGTLPALSLWKRPHLQNFYAARPPLTFSGRAAGTSPTSANGLGRQGAQSRHRPQFVSRTGLSAPRGLGAALVPPLSLVTMIWGSTITPRSPRGWRMDCHPRPPDARPSICALPA